LQEKVERAANYARVMEELGQLGNFVRLADYLFVEGVMACALTGVEELLALLVSNKQQVCMIPFQASLAEAYACAG